MKPCPKHPKYKANKKPTTQCTSCLSFYLAKKGKRIPIAPPGFAMKTPKEYTRKPKHKKDWKKEDE